MWSYTDTLYSDIDKLPSNFQEIYSKVYPRIINYLRIHKCNNIDKAREILDEERDEANNDLNNFYNSKEKKEFYICQLLNLREKIIDLKKNKDLFLNTPLEIFDFYNVEKGKIIIDLKSSNISDMLENISNNSILKVIKSPLFDKLHNYTKGGLVEKAIIQIIKNNDSPFGKFENIYYYAT